MYKLKESVQDFNGKYHGSIGIITTKVPNTKDVVTYPIHIDRVETELEQPMLSCHSISQEEGGLLWARSRIRMANIIDLTFPIPNVGYITPPGCFPTYIDRRAIKNTNRGWSSSSFTAKTPPVLTRIERPTPDYKYIRSSIDPEVVQYCFEKVKYTPLKELKNGVAFAALSKDFLAIKFGTKYALVYQNNLIGTIELSSTKELKVKISESVSALNDAFYAQVS